MKNLFLLIREFNPFTSNEITIILYLSLTLMSVFYFTFFSHFFPFSYWPTLSSILIPFLTLFIYTIYSALSFHYWLSSYLLQTHLNLNIFHLPPIPLCFIPQILFECLLYYILLGKLKKNLSSLASPLPQIIFHYFK